MLYMPRLHPVHCVTVQDVEVVDWCAVLVADVVDLARLAQERVTLVEDLVLLTDLVLDVVDQVRCNNG
jgi:hypothetical protein